MIADFYTIYYLAAGKITDKGSANGTYLQVLEAAGWTAQQQGGCFRLYHHATSTLYRPYHWSEALAFISHLRCEANIHKRNQGGQP